MVSHGSIVQAGWLAAVLTGLTTAPAGATYTVSGQGSPGKAQGTAERVVVDASLDGIAPQAATMLQETP
jgi:hypothetical protein